MVFDQLCKLAENFIPKIIPVLQRAALFQFPGRPHEILRREALANSDEELKFLARTFFLPFRTTAIEDTAGCVILDDVYPEQQGFNCPRVWIDSYLAGANPSEFTTYDGSSRDELEKLRSEGDWSLDSVILTIGVFTPDPEADENDIDKADSILSGVREIYIGNSEKCVQVKVDRLSEEQSKRVSRNAIIAVQELCWMNSPNRFVVEVHPTKVRKGHVRNSHSGKILRSVDRPLYTLLAPHEIRQKFGLPEYTGRHPQPHQRRKHYRCLKSERFTFMKGQVITIPACWVGEQEKIVGNKKYKVRLDL